MTEVNKCLHNINKREINAWKIRIKGRWVADVSPFLYDKYRGRLQRRGEIYVVNKVIRSLQVVYSGFSSPHKNNIPRLC